MELKPCPFCGAPVQFEENASRAVAGVTWSVMCVTENCILYAARPSLYPTKREAATAWNIRHIAHDRSPHTSEGSQT
jgi:hypothetical protein